MRETLNNNPPTLILAKTISDPIGSQSQLQHRAESDGPEYVSGLDSGPAQNLHAHLRGNVNHSRPRTTVTQFSLRRGTTRDNITPPATVQKSLPHNLVPLNQ